MTLCLLLVWGAAAGAEDVRIMMATDMHYITPQLYQNSDLLMESAKYGDGKMPHRSDAWLAALVAQALENKPDVLVLAGDQTFNGEVLSHRAISDALIQVQAAGIQVCAIPGNHDINNDNAVEFTAGGPVAIHSIPVSLYEKYYGAYGLAQAISRDESTFSYAVALREDLWLALLEAGIFEPFAEAVGLVTAETEAWLEAVLTQAEEAGAEVITVTHQSILPHSEVITGSTMIVNWGRISDLLIRHGVRLNLSGHLHVQHIARKEGLHDVALSALSNYPNQYAWITVKDDGSIQYETRALSPEHLPEGLPEEAETFFREASERNALRRLQGAEATEAQRRDMVAYAAWVNAHYYSGTVAQIADAAREAPAYRLWKELASDSFWMAYLEDMLLASEDMTRLSLP